MNGKLVKKKEERSDHKLLNAAGITNNRPLFHFSCHSKFRQICTGKSETPYQPIKLTEKCFWATLPNAWQMGAMSAKSDIRISQSISQNAIWRKYSLWVEQKLYELSLFSVSHAITSIFPLISMIHGYSAEKIGSLNWGATPDRYLMAINHYLLL